MLRLVLQFVGAIALTLPLMGPFATAEDNNQNHSFQLTLASRLNTEIQGKKQKLDADVVLCYTWSRQGGERTLSFDSVLLKVTQDGKQTMNTFMSRAKLTNSEDGKTEEVPWEKAPDELKKILRDSFDVPICKLQVDENGKELKREVVALPGAKNLVDHGMIANALLFHPPFPRGQKEWSAPAEVSMGNGAFAKGKLTYKAVGGKGGRAAKVSGTLTNENFKLPDKPLTIKNAKYVVNGEQTYDPSLREWVSGKLSIDVSFDMGGDKLVASAKGTMVVTLEKPAGKK